MKETDGVRFADGAPDDAVAAATKTPTPVATRRSSDLSPNRFRASEAQVGLDLGCHATLPCIPNRALEEARPSA
jgi:hypothetical protein